MSTTTVAGDIRLKRGAPEYWQVTFDLPPLNIFGPANIPQKRIGQTAIHVTVQLPSLPIRDYVIRSAFEERGFNATQANSNHHGNSKRNS